MAVCFENRCLEQQNNDYLNKQDDLEGWFEALDLPEHYFEVDHIWRQVDAFGQYLYDQGIKPTQASKIIKQYVTTL
jgi:hypothetical protein